MVVGNMQVLGARAMVQLATVSCLPCSVHNTVGKWQRRKRRGEGGDYPYTRICVPGCHHEPHALRFPPHIHVKECRPNPVFAPSHSVTAASCHEQAHVHVCC